jgi:hypothetical protein
MASMEEVSKENYWLASQVHKQNPDKKVQMPWLDGEVPSHQQAAAMDF